MATKTQSLARAVTRANKWRERYSPLRGLTVEKCRSLSESFLTGQSQELMWAFGAPFVGIECLDPDLLALIELRQSRLLAIDWDIRIAEDHQDTPKAKRQAKALRDAYDRFDNLYEAIAHLSLAPFRGFAHVEVDWQANLFTPIPQWNVVRDGVTGPWKYDPEGQFASFGSLPEHNQVDLNKHWWLIREHARPIGSWALLKFFYSALSSRDWAAFCNAYGIPGGVVVGPPNLPDTKEAAYESAANAIADGGRGYLPHGSDWKPNASARGNQPFESLLDWLAKKLVLAGTGGMLTMLAESGSGTLAGGAHSDTFDEIAQGEARRISEIFQRSFDRRVLQLRGLLQAGERPLAWWELAAGEETDPGDVVDQVTRLAKEGYRVEVGQLSEKTGYQFEEADEPSNETALKNACNGLKNSLQAEAVTTASPEPPTPQKPIFERPAWQAKLLALTDRIQAGEDAAIVDGLFLVEEATSDLANDPLFISFEEQLREAIIRGAIHSSAKPAPKSKNKPPS